MLLIRNSLLVVFTSLILMACSGDGISPPTGTPLQPAAGQAPTAAWPGALPSDFIQPWEELDADGRITAGVNADSEFLSGVERTHESSSGISDNGEAVHVASGSVGSGDVNWAMYRLLMGGEQPGVVGVDVNLAEMSDGQLSSYYVGLANYGKNCWNWFGPFTDNHVRISTGADVAKGGDYLTDLGNHFMCVAAFDGAEFDVVCVGANAIDAADTAAPPVPAGLAVVPVNGGLDLHWNSVIAGDLAGYRIYYSATDFTVPVSHGVQAVNYLIGQTSHLLAGLTDTTYVRISAVDINGNQSVLSDVVSDTPLAGSGPDLRLEAAAAGGLLNADITLTATGALNYDWDLDGDGIYDITGDTTGTQLADTGSTGIIRPSLRGTTADGSCVSCAAVSLIISGNSRPAANAYATPATGGAPLLVSLTGAGVDDDGTLVSYSWDFNGDGIYDRTDATDPGPFTHTYDTPDLYNTKFRVEDDLGSWDVDTIAIMVDTGPPGPNNSPAANLQASPLAGDSPFLSDLDAALSTDSDGTINRYDWDLDGDGLYEIYDGPATILGYRFDEPGYYQIGLRVTDDRGADDEMSITVTARGWINRIFPNSDPDDLMSLVEVNGRPAIAVEYDEESFFGPTYRRANDQFGLESWEDPVLGIDGRSYSEVSLAVVDGRPAIAYIHTDALSMRHMYFVRATDAAGTSWGTPVEVDSDDYTGGSPVLATVDDWPAVVYRMSNTPYEVRYCRALNAIGTLWGTPVTLYTGANTLYPGALITAGGNPAVVYRDSTNREIEYIRATDSTGGAWGAAQVIAFASVVNDNVTYCLAAVVEGNPAVVYKYYEYDAGNTVPIDYDIRYLRATAADGSTWGSEVVVSNNAWAIDYMGNLVIIDGNPAFCCEWDDGDNVMYWQAADTLGGTWAAPEFVCETNWSVYDNTCLAEVNGLAAIAYTYTKDDDSGDGALLAYALRID